MQGKGISTVESVQTIEIVSRFTPLTTISLPNGVSIAETSLGRIQIGAHLESVKDTLANNLLPKYYVLPRISYNKELGYLHYSSPEFPGLTKFITKSASTFISASSCSAYDREYLDLGLRPVTENFPTDVSRNYRNSPPNIVAESEFLGGRQTVDGLCSFKTFDPVTKTITLSETTPEGIKTVTITDLGENRYQIIDVSAQKQTVIDALYRPSFDQTVLPSIDEVERFKPTVSLIGSLGGRSGFNSNVFSAHRFGDTSGFFICDPAGNIILIDPPFNAILQLTIRNINPRRIVGIVVSHTHEDHDGGVLQAKKQLQDIYDTNPYVYSTESMAPKITQRKFDALHGHLSISQIDAILNMQIIESKFDNPEDFTQIGQYKFHFFHGMHTLESLGCWIENSSGHPLLYISGDSYLNKLKLDEAYNQAQAIDLERFIGLTRLPQCDNYLFDIGEQNISPRNPFRIHSDELDIAQLISGLENNIPATSCFGYHREQPLSPSSQLRLMDHRNSIQLASTPQKRQRTTAEFISAVALVNP
jgi:glyoxylase-like metal-dependent hydrolase (beta-lactamase superfamily II)